LIYKVLQIALLLLIFATCAKEDIIPVGTSSDDIKDTGIYHRDSTKSDAFCDFKPIENAAGCWSTEIQVSEDCYYNLLFTRYGDGWTGADATYSTPLPDGRIMWSFGDTFLGTVSAGRSRKGAPFIRNSLVIQDGDQMTTLYKNNGGDPTAFVTPDEPGTWYWPLDATIYQDELQMLLGKLGTGGSGESWDFEYRRFDLAILDPITLKIQSITPKVESPDISYGSCVLEDNDYLYIYGIWSHRRKTVHVARVADGNMNNPWTFFDGKEWVSEPSDFVIARNVSDQFSMLKKDDKYYLITHETIFGRRIFIAESDKPTGPFTNRRTLFCTPETPENVFTYNSFVHPEIGTGAELRISYNINSFDFNDILNDVDLYRPIFIKIENWQ